MDEIVAHLLANTNALGVWLMKGVTAVASATRDASVTMPRVHVAGETAIELGDTHLFAFPIRGLTLVVVFKTFESSLGLVRLRVKQAQQAIETELEAGRWF